MRRAFFMIGLGGIYLLSFIGIVVAQEAAEPRIQVTKEAYLIGEEKNLEIIVHVWGEVRVPGEKRVPDGITILELISKAGGPTEFSDLSNVMLFSKPSPALTEAEKAQLNSEADRFVLEDLEQLHATGRAEINIKKYLKNGKAQYLPRLLPGDVVQVKRNVWHKWQAFIRVVSQVAIVAQVWYWYSRID